MAGSWGRLAAALHPQTSSVSSVLRALRRPHPLAPRHQMELLLLLLEFPRELCGGPGGVPAVCGALLELLMLPHTPPGPPRALLLLATVTILLATGAEGSLGVAPFVALLLQEVEGVQRGGAPAAAAECLRELLRARGPGDPPRMLPPGARRSLLGRLAVASAVQPLVLLLAEDPDESCHTAGADPGASPGTATLTAAGPGEPHITRGLSSSGFQRATSLDPTDPHDAALTDPGNPLCIAPLDPKDPHGTALRDPAIFLHDTLPDPRDPGATASLDSRDPNDTAPQDPREPHGTPSPDPGPTPPRRLLAHSFLLTPAAQAQLLWVLRGTEGAPPSSSPVLNQLLPTAEPALLHAALWGSRDGLCPIPATLQHRLASLAQHPALHPSLRLFFLLCLGTPPVPPLPPHLAASLFPTCADPPELLLPHFELAAAACSRGGDEGERGSCWLQALVMRLAAGGGPPGVFCRAMVALSKHLGGSGDPPVELAAAATALLLRCPHFTPQILEAAGGAGGWGGALGAALRQGVLGAPLPQNEGGLRGYLRVLAQAPGPPRPKACSRYLRRLAAQWGRGGDWRGGQGVLSATAPLLPHGAPPLTPQTIGGGDLDVSDRAGLHAALTAALGPPKLVTILAAPPLHVPPPRVIAEGGVSALGLRSVLPPFCLHRLPVPPPPLPPPFGAPPDPRGYGRAVARGGAAGGLQLCLRLEPHNVPSPPPLWVLALLLQVGGAQGRLVRLGPGGAELGLTLRPSRALPPVLPVSAVFSSLGGAVAVASLPPLPLPVMAQLRPLAVPPPWDAARRRRMFDAMWETLGGGPETRVVWEGGPPPATLTPFVLDEGDKDGGWVAAASLPPRGLALLWGREGHVDVRCQRWGALIPLAQLLRGEG
ncbi:AP-5 complex subunit beta-1 [Numida meleagris]|uniref:AP-5 complex subunit beta-1 n=1 Tax=Numida meleagris TaxID=8996 RepID=UPI000B3DC8EC|nr:AP-5 complex subunit beta-1 [Numida meleagris]